MPHIIIQSTAGVTLFDGEALDAENALFLLARQAGYEDYEAAADAIGKTYWGARDELLIYEPDGDKQ